VTAGLETLRALREPGVYETLESRAAALEAGLCEALGRAGVPTTVNRVGSMLTAFFTAGAVTDWGTATRADRARYGRFFHAMLGRGVYLAPSQFEAAFVSLAHSPDDVAATVAAAAAGL